jgi:hypothetical protein
MKGEGGGDREVANVRRWFRTVAINVCLLFNVVVVLSSTYFRTVSVFDFLCCANVLEQILNSYSFSRISSAETCDLVMSLQPLRGCSQYYEALRIRKVLRGL